MRVCARMNKVNECLCCVRACASLIRSHGRYGSSLLAMVRAVCSVGLLVSAVTQVLVQNNGDVEAEGVALGTGVWAVSSVVVWLANAYFVVRTATRRAAVADFVKVCMG